MPNKKNKVSVIVVNYNGMPYLETCLSSVINQDFPDFEVILVDNNSEDGSVEYVRGVFPEVLVVTNQKNVGYSAGINTGIAQASGVYYAPLNVDTEVKQSWLAPMAEFMDANPDAGAVTPKSLLYRNRHRIGVQGLDIHITGLGFVRGLNEVDNSRRCEPFPVAAVSGSSFLIRREIIEIMGGLNEDNFMYYDDVDLSWMINLMGYRIYCVPKSIVYHEYELKMTPQKMYWLEYGRLSSLFCYLKSYTFIVLMPALAFTEAQIIGYCLIRGPRYTWAKVRAGIAVLKNIKRLTYRRKKTQRLRQLSDYQILRRFRINYQWGQIFSILK